ncbi:SDR family NAD(P)-dependent oxidoreductase [Paraburkholderia caribensis]|uniref:SDR family NAD(P)-dependent oxidoreductase n=1 Tax=Paraburkholderia caribensis TaxID=75105 RepID=UPI001CAAAFAB|nr:SDR family NAD(P)-dependent oxidoreductase [Paraburkholderia caribensis]CAG9243799.1 Levodione reductase [Paraburkholderia caribensis]
MSKFDGKVVLVTGAAGGIGRAVSSLFVESGARVHLVDVQEGPLKEIADLLGPAATYSVADVSDEGDTQKYVKDALALSGRIDVAFLNAGIVGAVARIEDTPLDVYDRVMKVNVRGVWLGLAQTLPLMKTQGFGSIIVTSSITGLRGSSNQAAYTASKHAVIGLAKTAALEGAASGVRVNAICPAPIDTEMMRTLAAGIDPENAENGKKKVLSGIPLGRYGTAEEVAKLVSFLASDDAAYCTGSTYTIDGGGTAGPVR